MSTNITSFRGTFLSNFWPAPVTYEGVTYPSVEHAYVAAKVGHFPELLSCTPGQAKRLGRKNPVHSRWGSTDGWNDGKLAVMAGLLRQKFKIPDLAHRLAATGDAELVEGNTWNDVFWGVCRGRGENHLGRLLMTIRAEL